jgi:hypothetical protein
MSTRRNTSGRECARALWLLGLEAPVTKEQLATAWRSRVARTHPDRHASSGKGEAATTLTRALNEARSVISEWIASGREWPTARGERVLRFDEPEPWPERPPEPPPAPVCRHTGLRRGDRVRVWPYEGEEVRVVAGTERDVRSGRSWVRLEDGPAVRAERVRLAAFSCPVCGFCSGPEVEEPTVRPCPECLVDLRRLERDAAEARRIRTAIEARSQAGLAAAERLGDPRLADRASERQRWARRLRGAQGEELHTALLGAFGRAFERWSGAA